MTTGPATPRPGSPPVFDAAVLSRRTFASWPGLEISVARARIGDGVVSASRSPEHKLFLTIAGATTLTETRTEGGRPYSGRDAPGAVSLVPAGRHREGRYVGGWMEYARVLVAPALLHGLAGGEGAAQAPGALAPADNVQDPLIQGVVLALKEQAEGGGAGDRLYVEALVAALCAHLARRYADPTGPPPPPRPASGGLAGQRLLRVRDLLDGDLAGGVGLAELAAAAGLSPVHFARQFKRATGSAPHQYLLRRRVERAQELLRAGELPIASVAHACGFSSQAHLTTTFRKAVGATPAAYRRTVRG